MSSLGIIALVIFGVLLFLRRENYDGEIDEKYVEDEVVPLQGPPATVFAGPPATTEHTTDPMLEYQRQVEEYNRKMAEYNAWQEAQGSQAYIDPANHE